ncbi:MAG: response regulator [Candidatus Thiodiazotropha sp.]
MKKSIALATKPQPACYDGKKPLNKAFPVSDRKRMNIKDLSVILVEPSQTQRKLIAKQLAELGIGHIETYNNGSDTLQALPVSKPDVVISSLYLPDMTGTDLVFEMRDDEELLSEAGNGVEAVGLISQHYYDLVISDYNMPEMNGQELVDHIRSESGQPGLPILMVTSESNENRLAAVQKSGVSAICDKPFTTDSIQQILQQILQDL